MHTFTHYGSIAKPIKLEPGGSREAASVSFVSAVSAFLFWQPSLPVAAAASASPLTSVYPTLAVKIY
ncbi:hypothetical protein EB796_002265 [Bugula neritina]|uniref:Uncharacterized protein n=1 Tax=Bugula neritina TaxID=10212 RepID=A0A7J7KMP5_BUGNE|nr:hypothetical protein EB796_002265 [Bugula neritina]